MIKDFTNAFIFPTSQKAIIEASKTETYLRQHPEIQQRIRGTQKLMEQLIADYKEVLGVEGSIRAKMLNSFIREPAEYKSSFMVNALMMCYRVFDSSHTKYPRLLELVKENDPEWLERMESDHKAKIARCKVPIVEID